MTDEDKKDFETATHCFICGDRFNKTHIRRRKKQRNTKKFATIVTLQVSIEGALIACVI